MNFNYGADFGVFGALSAVVFVAVIGIIVAAAVKGAGTWHKNNQSPCLSAAATVISKRTEVIQHRHPNAGDITGAHGYSISSSKRFYVAFQMESGKRMEFSVAGPEHDRLTEGDEGTLTYQGTRYLAFEKKAH